MTDEDTRQFYDLRAESTADEWYENDVLMASIRDFVSLLPEKPRILDLGCGPGHESMRLASTGAEVIGIDSNAFLNPAFQGGVKESFIKLEISL